MTMSEDANKFILDACCGSRMFWFDKHQKNTVFQDIRDEEHILCDGRALAIHPDVIADCRKMSFPDKSFKLVVLDPPHLNKIGRNSWMCKKYGQLPEDWRSFINDSVEECMRVLDDYGILILKWSEDQIRVSDLVKSIRNYNPLFGHPTRRRNTTIWLCFMKIPKTNGRI